MYPERMVCLAAEIPEILHRLGALDRIVGISAYTTRPIEALSISKVSGFSHGSVKKIMENRPDLVILTSGVQKDLAAALAAEGVTILHLNPHRLEDMFDTIQLLANLVNRTREGEAYCAELRTEVGRIQKQAAALPVRPRVYFEEWMDPIIVGTGWVSDLVELAGGIDVFRERSIHGRRAADRTVESTDIIAASPDIILASWCGKAFQREEFVSRPGMADVPAVRKNQIYELTSEVLQCGPMLIDSLKQIHGIFRDLATSPLESTV